MTKLEEAQERIKEAVQSEDETYIAEFQQGIQASSNGDKLEPKDQTQAFIDGYTMNEDQKSNPIRNRLNFAPHPMGGIGVTLYGSDGSHTQGRLELDAAALAQANLGALITMMISTAYMMQAQAAEQAASGSKIVVPGR